MKEESNSTLLALPPLYCGAASDIGKVLGCGAYLTALRRTRSGCFHVRDSVDGKDLLDENAREKLMNKVLSVSDVSNLLQ